MKRNNSEQKPDSLLSFDFLMCAAVAVLILFGCDTPAHKQTSVTLASLKSPPMKHGYSDYLAFIKKENESGNYTSN